MKSLTIAAVLFTCSACSQNVPVTNDPGSTGTGAAEAELESQLVPQCKQICGWMVTCPGLGSSDCTCEVAAPAAGGASSSPTTACDCGTPSPMTMDECLGTCLGELGMRFIGKGEACAELGVDLLECYSKLKCADVIDVADAPCGWSAAKSFCPNRGSSDDSADMPDTNPSISGSGGTTGVAPTTNNPFGATNPTSVICTSGSNGGKAPTVDGPQPNEFLCEQGLTNCSDGHSYRVSCGTTQDLVVMCQCIFDGHAQATFEDNVYLSSNASSSACISVASMSSKCGWSLTDPTVN